MDKKLELIQLARREHITSLRTLEDMGYKVREIFKEDLILWSRLRTIILKNQRLENNIFTSS